MAGARANRSDTDQVTPSTSTSPTRTARTIALALIACLACAPAFPAGFTGGLEEARKAAEAGDGTAMIELGRRHREGDGVVADDRLACDWFTRAAAIGDRDGMTGLGLCHLDGRGRPLSGADARTWLGRAGDAGNGRALRTLAELHAAGRGVPEDKARAADLYRRAALAGDRTSMMAYAMALETGSGVARSEALACDFFEQAGRLGDIDGLTNVGLCHLQGSGRPRDLTIGRKFFEDAGARGGGGALRALGVIHANGLGVPADLEAGAGYFRRSAEAGHAGGMTSYGTVLYFGRGVARDQNGACDWFEKAADAGNIEGANAVAVCFEQGTGRPKNLGEAVRRMRSAAESGSNVAMRNLARYLDRGLGTPRDPKAAADWLIRAMAAGNDDLLNAFISEPDIWQAETRREIQARLKADGRYDGPVDGLPNAGLDEALWDRVARLDRGRLLQQFVRVPMAGAPEGLLVRVCARPGEDRRRLVVMNHGMTTVAAERRLMRPDSCGAVAEFFVERGYTVLLPLRRGYGETGGAFLEAGTLGCRGDIDFTAAGFETARDMRAVLAFFDGRPDVIAGETVVFGHSGGGWGTLALASDAPDGIAGLINFSGSHGSQRGRPNGNCPQTPDSLERSVTRFARAARLPMLWLYVENDTFIGPALARRLHRTYVRAGGKADLHVLPAFEEEGHYILNGRGVGTWGPVIGAWLDRLQK